MLKQINDWNLKTELGTSADPLVLFVTGTGCAACRRPRLELQALADEHPDARFREIDVVEHPTLAQELNIARIPTTLVYVGGDEVERHVGPGAESVVRRVLGWTLELGE